MGSLQCFIILLYSENKLGLKSLFPEFKMEKKKIHSTGKTLLKKTGDLHSLYRWKTLILDPRVISHTCWTRIFEESWLDGKSTGLAGHRSPGIQCWQCLLSVIYHSEPWPQFPRLPKLGGWRD